MTAGSSSFKRPFRAVTMVTALPEHIQQLFHWFGSKNAMYAWGGPGIRYPSNQVYFLRTLAGYDWPALR